MLVVKLRFRPAVITRTPPCFLVLTVMTCPPLKLIPLVLAGLMRGRLFRVVARRQPRRGRTRSRRLLFKNSGRKLGVRVIKIILLIFIRFRRVILIFRGSRGVVVVPRKTRRICVRLSIATVRGRARA